MTTRTTHNIDAKGKVLGRLATEIAVLLRGKQKTGFNYREDMGDEVVVTNARHIRLTGRKLDQKIYYRHSTYPGSIKSETARQLIAKRPEQMITQAVKNMLPNNRLRPNWLKRLKFAKNEAQNG